MSGGCLEAGLEVTLLKIFVDDVRQASTILDQGVRYSVEKKEMEWSEEAFVEDKKKEREGE